MNQVHLTDEQLILLDGHVDGETQGLIDVAKLRLSTIEAMPQCTPAEAGFIADAVREAATNGILICKSADLAKCRVCGEQHTYAIHTRNGKYHQKGSLNLDKPLYLRGVELADRFVNVKGYPHLGCCKGCWDRIKPLVSEAVKDIRAEIHRSITGTQPKWTKYHNCYCTKCDWKGHLGQLGLLPAVMGGNYRGVCPSCEAKNTLFASMIRRDSDSAHFTVIESGTENTKLYYL